MDILFSSFIFLGEWLGVEWDEPDVGRSNGIYGGKRYFKTRFKYLYILRFFALFVVFLL